MANDSANEKLNLDEYSEELDFDTQEAVLSQELEDAFADLELSEEERKSIGNPESLGKVIQDEIWKQFSNQIGLEATSDNLIDNYNKAHPEDSGTYNQKVGERVLNDKAHKDAVKAANDAKNAGTLVDDYTGKPLGPNDTVNVDHVVSRKEIFENERRKQAGLSTKELANKKENERVTNENLNKAMQDVPKKEYVENRDKYDERAQKKHDSVDKKINESNASDSEKQQQKAQNDQELKNKLDADDDLILEADKEARKAINKDIAKEAQKNINKKAVKDGLKTMAISALMELLKKIMNGFVRFMKSNAKSFKSFLGEMKESLKAFISKISDFLKTGTTTAVGSIVSEIFGPIVATFKKLASLIKQGISSFVDAVRFLINPANKNMPFAIKVANVGKIIVSGLTAAGAVFLGEAIGKAMESVGVLQIKIPLLDMTLDSIVGTFLASLISGLIGAIVMNLIDKFIAKRLKEANLVQIVEKKNRILEIQEKQKDLAVTRLVNTKQTSAASIVKNHAEADMVVEKALGSVFNELDMKKAEQVASTSNDDAFADMQSALESLL